MQPVTAGSGDNGLRTLPYHHKCALLMVEWDWLILFAPRCLLQGPLDTKIGTAETSMHRKFIICMHA